MPATSDGNHKRLYVLLGILAVVVGLALVGRPLALMAVRKASERSQQDRRANMQKQVQRALESYHAGGQAPPSPPAKE